MSDEAIEKMQNGKAINPISATIMVEKLDWSKLNPILNQYLHNRFPDRKDERWAYQDDYCGLVHKRDVFVIITKEACFMPLEILNVKNRIIGFKIEVFPIVDGERAMVADWNFQLPIDEIDSIKTGEIVSLNQFMDDRYKYNPRIDGNEFNFLKYLKDETNYFKK